MTNGDIDGKDLFKVEDFYHHNDNDHIPVHIGVIWWCTIIFSEYKWPKFDDNYLFAQ